ncbi:hypothetical protein AVEN_145703-1, partial [Araneus ventricosus]
NHTRQTDHEIGSDILRSRIWKNMTDDLQFRERCGTSCVRRMLQEALQKEIGEIGTL